MEEFSQGYSYLYLEVCVLAMVLAFWNGRLSWKVLYQNGFLHGTLILFLLWTVVDQIAIALALWEFPAEGNLPIRILGLPIEEYCIFILHAILTFAIIDTLREEPT